MQTMRRTVLALGVAMAVGLAGCGGDEPTEPTAEESTDQDTSGQDDQESSDTDEEAASDGADDASEESDASATAAFAGPREPVRITYRMTGASDIDELTLAWDPPRFAMLFEEGKVILDEDGTIFCDAAGEACFRLGADAGGGQMAAGVGPFMGFASALQDGEELPGATVTGEAEIAGRTATCATYDAAEYDASLQGEAEYCYDPEAGVLLRWSATDAQGTTQTLEAVEVGEPDAQDFEPTGEVQEMPGMGGQDG